MSESSEQDGFLIKVPIVWEITDDVSTYYANNVLVQNTEHEFIISLFQTFPPPIAGTPNEIEEQIKHIGVVKARCVARVIVSPNRMEDFVRAFQESVDKHHRKTESMVEIEDDA